MWVSSSFGMLCSLKNLQQQTTDERDLASSRLG
jgi:hypothetical protein